MKAKTELEIPVLVVDSIRALGEVGVVVECFTTDRESLRSARRMLKEEWSLWNARRITLLALGRKLKIALSDRR